jgi:putative tricarboxylic transport membrane protein
MDREKIGSIFLIGLSVVVCIYSIKIGIGSPSNPGSGFMPLIAGLSFGILSLLQIAKLYFVKKSKLKTTNGETKEEAKKGESKKKIILVIVSLVAYSIIMPKLGYLISTFFLIIFLLRIGNGMKWRFILPSSLFITLSTYLIFDRWLSCRFPVGIFQYWR